MQIYESIDEDYASASSMRKALAQNPNLLRTLLGLSLTLILLLTYAVYGATVSPDYYVYQNKTSEINYDTTDVQRDYDEDNDETTWRWYFIANSTNLTWVNLSANSLASGSHIELANGAGLWSHASLGVADAREFSCAVNCVKSSNHQRSEKAGVAVITALTSTDPARRDGGSVAATSMEQAVENARAVVKYDHTPSLMMVVVVEQGNRSTSPGIEFTTVNEELVNVEQFSVDAVTEFAWAMAAVIGCFTMVLIPSFTVFFAARAKDARKQAQLEQIELITTSAEE